MEIGRLYQRIEIIKMVNGVNEEGIFTEIPETVARPYCEVAKTTIKEFKEKDVDVRKKTIDFIIRYQQKVEIDSGMIVIFRNKQYEIKNVEPDYQDYERQMLKCEVYE